MIDFDKSGGHWAEAADIDKWDAPGWTPGGYATSTDEFCRILEAAGVPRADYTVVPGFSTLTA